MPSLTLPAWCIHAQDSKRLSKRVYAVLLTLCLIIFCAGISTFPPTDRDESLFAQASKQMIETDNYVDIRFQDQPRYKKPVGIYWLQSAAVHLVGTEHRNDLWVYRLPSVMGATTTVVATASLGAILFTPATGLVAALMMMSCLLLNVEAHLAKTDAALLGCILLASLGLARAFFARHRSACPTFALFWGGLGMGILIKGPIILLPLAGALIGLFISRSSPTPAQTRSPRAILKPFWGILFLLLLILPWFIAIYTQSHGAFIQESAGNDLLSKIGNAKEHGIKPPGMHLLMLPLLFFPASLLIMLAVPDTWNSRHERPVAFLLGWAGLTWLIFELTLTKLLHYVLPAYPALAILAAKALHDGFPVLCALSRRAWISVATTTWVLIGVALPLFVIVLPLILGDNDPHTFMLWIGGPFILLQVYGLILLRTRRLTALSVLTGAATLFYMATFAYALPKTPHVWIARDILQSALPQTTCPSPTIISVGYNAPSLIFLGGTTTQTFNDSGAAADAFAKTSCALVLVKKNDNDAFLAHLSPHKIQPRLLGDYRGFDLGRGRMTDLIYYTSSP